MMSIATRMRFPLAIVLALGGCAMPVLPSGEVDVPLPAEMAPAIDLRGAYRAALCARPGLTGSACAQTLYRFAGEVPAAAPPAAVAARYRLLFVPGFLASCFTSLHTFADVVAAAREAGFAVDELRAGGRDSIAANARGLAEQIARLPPDGRRLVVIAHSKGAADILEMLVAQPGLAARIDAIVGVTGAFGGSPLADSLAFAYRVTFGAYPFEACAEGEGDPMADLEPVRRRAWWAAHGQAIRVPVYSLVTVPTPDRISAMLLLPQALLGGHSRYNDGMLLAADQLAPGGRLLGVVNADHVSAAIPYPPELPWVLWFTTAQFPRADVVLAAIDVVAAQSATGAGAPAVR
jgi:hypothetical protein